MDISLCSNSKCTKRASCMRYRGVPSNHQTYGYFQQDSKGNCEMHWDIQGWNSSMLVPLRDADRRNSGGN